jgi:hypothetical protein
MDRMVCDDILSSSGVFYELTYFDKPLESHLISHL